MNRGTQLHPLQPRRLGSAPLGALCFGWGGHNFVSQMAGKKPYHEPWSTSSHSDEERDNRPSKIRGRILRRSRSKHKLKFQISIIVNFYEEEFRRHMALRTTLGKEEAVYFHVI